MRKNRKFGEHLQEMIACVAAVLLLSLLSLSTSAAEQTDFGHPYVWDEENLLTLQQKSDLLDRMKEKSDAENCHIAVVTVSNLTGKSAWEYAKNFYIAKGLGRGENSDGILLLISQNEREWAIYTHGVARGDLSESDLNELENAVVPYLSALQYEEACIAFANSAADLLAAAKNSAFPWTLLWISLGLGLIFALVCVGVMHSKMNSVRKKKNADGYVRQGSLDLRDSRDIYLYSTVTRVAKPKDDDRNRTSGGNRGGRSGKF